jgi:hypothetical protein
MMGAESASQMRRKFLSLLVRGVEGHLQPVSADIISQRLFQASERLGQPRVFLARELADRIVECLADDPEPLSETELHEQVAKFVREFGYPVLAWAYWQEIGASQATVGWPRDVDSLRQSGLLVLDGETPVYRLADLVLRFPDDGQPGDEAISRSIEQGSRISSAVTWDAFDEKLAQWPGPCHVITERAAKVLTESVERHRVVASVHLNCAGSLARASDSASPLFADFPRPSIDESRRRLLALSLARMLAGQPRVRLYWHIPLSERCRIDPADIPDELRQLVRAQVSLEWVFDRPREDISLGPGLSRSHGAVLAYVGCHCHRLVAQLGPVRWQEYREKLRTLTRLARSAARCHYQHLRGAGVPEWREGFLLERSRFVLVPIGLEAAVRQLCDERGLDERTLIERTEELLTTMQGELSQTSGLPMGIIDGWPGDFLQTDGQTAGQEIRGLTGWDPRANVLEQLRLSEALQRQTQTGTAALWVSPALLNDANEFVTLLQRLARSEVRRWRLMVG